MITTKQNIHMGILRPERLCYGQQISRIECDDDRKSSCFMHACASGVSFNDAEPVFHVTNEIETSSDTRTSSEILISSIIDGL